RKKILLTTGVDLIDFKPLRVIEEERLVDTPGQPAIQFGCVAGRNDEQMLACGNAVGAVVDQWAVAVESEAIIHVALHAVECEYLFAWRQPLNLTCQGTG